MSHQDRENLSQDARRKEGNERSGWHGHPHEREAETSGERREENVETEQATRLANTELGEDPL
ncbi:hypothetical protein [Nocardia stercoris]|uniref:Uncharacterized protein n=1 Tax=Nocardia stercoris TaxID=2483361 RepID=A0A3M2L0G1_9NOCA|nr:hypothetical protein [Nocardia stercoris]RMI30874.1 hypothetical protein EBN03_19725 [Nocardia stercoris]